MGGCGGNAAPYVLGALPDAERAQFEEHLRTCAVCREEVASLEAVTAVLPAAAPHVPAPPALKRRVMAAARAELRGRERAAAPHRSRRALVPAIAVGALAAVVAAIVLAGGGGSGSTRILRGEVAVPGARALLAVAGGRGQLSLSGMPQPRPGHVYELWVKRAGAPQPTDVLFTVSSRGSATAAVPGSMSGVRAVLVTAEPLGGSRVPTSRPLLLVNTS
jgi:anti-sigma factor RsiW